MFGTELVKYQYNFMKSQDCQMLSSAIKREREIAHINRESKRSPRNDHSALGTMGWVSFGISRNFTEQC